MIGFLGGVLYEVFSLIRKCFGCPHGKNKAVGIATDICFCLLFVCFCTAAGYALAFPDFRTYMWLGYLFGGILYLKSLHKIIAFFEKVCYNGINKLIKKAKNEKKLFKKERKEV